jgi:hypothetical protein
MSTSRMTESNFPTIRRIFRLGVLGLPNVEDNGRKENRLMKCCVRSQDFSLLNKALRETTRPIAITGKLSPSRLEVEMQKMEEAYFSEACERSTWNMFEIVSRSR